MFWYIVMALIGGWLIGWTTRGILDRRLDFRAQPLPQESSSSTKQSMPPCECCGVTTSIKLVPFCKDCAKIEGY